MKLGFPKCNKCVKKKQKMAAEDHATRQYMKNMIAHSPKHYAIPEQHKFHCIVHVWTEKGEEYM